MALTLKVSPEFRQITVLKEKFIAEGCYELSFQHIEI